MPAWLIPAITAAGSIAASAIGKSRTKTLLNREQGLTDIQSDANKSLALYNQKLQMDMWEKTGPQGQMEQLNKAGLNPGLIYGMGGAGGQTANAAQAAPVGKGSDSSGGRTKADDILSQGMATAAQIGLIKAQTENVQADTANKTADLPNKPLTGANIQADTASKTQGIQNQKAQETLTKINAEIAETENKIKSASAENTIALIQSQMLRNEQALEADVRNNYINESTKQTEINRRKQELINMGVEKVLKEQLTRESGSNVQVNDAQIQNMAKQITLKYDELYQNATSQNRELNRREMEDFMKQQNIPVEVGEKLLNILGLRAILGGGERNIIQGFKQKY